MNFLRVTIRFKSSIYIATIANLVVDILMNAHGQRGLFMYHSFYKYSLRWLYHMRLDYFNPYKDLYNLIEFMLRCFKLFALGIWKPWGIFIYMSLSKDSYKYVVITSIRYISSHSKTTKLIKYLNVIMSITKEYVFL